MMQQHSKCLQIGFILLLNTYDFQKYDNAVSIYLNTLYEISVLGNS